MALYLLDANVLIDAHRDYYPMSRVPEFWDWLAHQSAQGRVKMPREIYKEVKSGRDDLAVWLKRGHEGHILLLQEEADPQLVTRVVERGYGNDLTDADVVKLGHDPFLIAYALANPGSRRVVTTEGSKPARMRGNRHIPDVCKDLGVVCRNTFEFIRDLDFKTGWRSGRVTSRPVDSGIPG